MSTGLLHADGRAISPREIGHARRIANIAPPKPRASLAQGPTGGGFNPYAYDGAVPFSPDMPAWYPALRSADNEINFDRMRLAARARDLVRNDGWAKGAITRILASVVGAEFFPIPKPNHSALARRFGAKFDATWALEYTSAIRAEYHIHANDPRFFADATRTQTLTQMFRTALWHKLVDGDSVAMSMWDTARVEQGANYATCLQLIEPERLCNPQWAIDTEFRRGGVQVDGLQAPVGYHIQRGHSFDWFSPIKSITWDYHPRETEYGRPVMIHDFERVMARQHRGVGILTAALARLQKMNRYDDASLMAALLRATMGLFIISGRDEEEIADSMNPTQIGADGLPVEGSDFFGAWNYYKATAANTLGGVRIPMMAPGDNIKSVSGSGQTDDYEAINKVGHRYLAAVTGQGTPEVSNDFSELNYSSYRGELMQAWRVTKMRRYDFAHGTCTPFYVGFGEEVLAKFPELLPRGLTYVDIAENRSALFDVDWYGPGMGWTDPVKERQGEVLGLDAAFGSLEDTCATVEGVFWRDRLEQRAMELAEMNRLGLKQPDWAGEQPASAVDKKPQAA